MLSAQDIPKTMKLKLRNDLVCERADPFLMGKSPLFNTVFKIPALKPKLRAAPQKFDLLQINHFSEFLSAQCNIQ